MANSEQNVKTKLWLAALAYIENNYRVIPCRPGDKIALIKDWQNNPLDTAAKVDAFWGQNQHANIAAMPEDQGLAVIDCDPGASPDDLKQFPPTLTIGTPRGGEHRYYIGSLPGTVGKLAPHVDTRGRQSYCLLPPSIVNGAEYIFKDDRPAVALPDDILAKLTRAHKVDEAGEERADLPGNVATARTRLSNLVREGTVAIEGKGGDDLTYRVACELVRDLGISPKLACDLMLELWYPHCTPNNVPEFVRQKITSAATYGQNTPGAYAAAPPSEAFADANLTASPTKEPVRLDFVDLTESLKPKPTRKNTRIAIQIMKIKCSYDVFHNKLLINGSTLPDLVGEVSDHVALRLSSIIRDWAGFEPTPQVTHDALVQECLEHRFDPVLDYLDALTWDGTPRLETWLTKYMSAEDTPLNRAIGKLTLIAAARRVRQPGCKFDQIIVFESAEGYGKSTAITIMAGAENFSDQTVLGLRDREAQEQLAGVWLYECADLSGITKADIDKMKAFASRTEDRARPAYGRSNIRQPRRCVIMATTNNSTYLQSQTGNRRFWPVVVGKIDLDVLRRDRDQLWAEAAHVEATGISLTLPEELWPHAASEQEKRREEDPWEDTLSHLRGHAEDDGLGVLYEERLHSDEIWRFLKLDPKDQSKNTWGRIKFAMKRLEWEHMKSIRINGVTRKGYRRPWTGPLPVVVPQSDIDIGTAIAEDQ